MIERWKDDPNASVVRWAAEIQDHRRKAHEALAELSDAVKEQE